MEHNHIPELRDIIIRYQAVIWPLMKPGIETSLIVLGDYPSVQILQRLRDYSETNPLKAICNLADYGTIVRRAAHFGTYAKDSLIRVGITITTADPSLREYMGGRLIHFCDRNPGLIKGTHSRWNLEQIGSGGIESAPPSLYARSYSMLLREIS